MCGTQPKDVHRIQSAQGHACDFAIGAPELAMNTMAVIDAGLKGAGIFSTERHGVGALLWQLNVPEGRQGQGALLTMWPVSWQVTTCSASRTTPASRMRLSWSRLPDPSSSNS